MNQLQENIKISLLYLIKTDYAQDFQLDKIDFLNQSSNCNIIKEGQLVQIKGFFGTHKEIEREVEQEIINKVNLFPYLNLSERGILIAIAFENQLLFCLILSETFFITKPINEKAIEIVLFRILQDLTDNIKFCLSDTILNQKWYKGEVIPFSTQILQRNDYNFNDEQNKEVKLNECQWKLSEDILNHEIINSQTQSPKLFAIQFFQSNISLAQLIQDCQNEYQSKSLGIFQELGLSGKEVKEQLQKLIFKSKTFLWSIPQNLQNMFIQQSHTCKIEQNNQWQGEKFVQEQNPSQMEYDDEKSLQIKQVDDLEQNNEKNNNLESIVEGLKKQIYYKVQKVSLIAKRCDDNQSQLVKDIVQNATQTIILNNDSFQLDENCKFQIIDIFDTKEKFTIYIIQSTSSQNQKSQTHVFLQMHKAHQPKQIIKFDYKDSYQAVYFYDYNKGQLYIFNFKENQVHQLLITETGMLKSSQWFCNQQQNNKFFIIEKVAYLSDCDKFIVLSKDGVFKQQDQRQGFEKVKSTQQIKNETIETEFTPSIRPDCRYDQIHTCPSGKYFYLANNYCCDRYDSICMRINSIEIEGPIKIFADHSDIIILGQLKHKDLNEKQAKIISNAVTQKKFHKQQNNEQEIIGNPALDIVKGSFVKFGPNSRFLLKEKKRTINLYANQEYCDILEPYLNIMSVNGVILSSSKFQVAEVKSHKIKNIIYSRVPLQLCTIENSNLIPLIDGFRQESQTQSRTSLDQKVKQLHLGFLEEHLYDCNKKIFVVGIIGRQSTGKSYLLNRVFGTRFSVSSARCTDGVWASIAYVEDQTFLILDCEGLFNGARTEKEEIKMLAFLTAISDITILNSNQLFGRDLTNLFKNLVEASKQLNDQNLFKGILYFVLRDVSSNDNLGVEQDLLQNLERLKQAGSEEIVFLKRLFQNQFSVEKLFNYETNKFDEQLISVRKYFLDSSVKSNRWNGLKLIQMMKILLCQLEISDNTNASLIELQIRIEKIFDQSKEQWYQFTSDEIKCENLKLVQSKYQFQKFPEHQHILYNKDLLKQLYEDLEIKDSIQTHNNNLKEVQSQLNKLLEFRKEQIMLRTQQEISCIDNQEVQIMIKYSMQNLHTFFEDQMKIYKFCLEKCNQCHLFCKQFKNHIEIFKKLNCYIDNEIKNLRNRQRNLEIKSHGQEKEKRDNIQKIETDINEAQNLLDGLIIQYEINEFKQKYDQTVTAMINYEFYNKNENCINLFYFEINNYNKEHPKTVHLDKIQTIKEEITQLIQELKIQQTQYKQSIYQKNADLENCEKDNCRKLEDLSEMQRNLQLSKMENEQKYIEKNEDLQRIKSEIFQLNNDEEIDLEQEAQKLLAIQNQVQDLQKIEEKKNEELLQFQKINLSQFLDELEKEMKPYAQQSISLDENIDELEDQLEKLKEIRVKIKNEQGKKVQNQKKIQKLNLELNGINEEEIQNQLNQYRHQKQKLEENSGNSLNSDNLDNFNLLKECQQDIGIEEQETNENIFQGELQFDEAKTQKDQEITVTIKQRVINLFLKKKGEQLRKFQNLILSNMKSIEIIEQNIRNLKKGIAHQDTYSRLDSEISEIQRFQEDLDNELKKIQQEQHRNQQNLKELREKQQQWIQDNQNLQNKIIEIDQQLSKLISQLDQINAFCKHLNQHHILSESLKEKSAQLKIWKELKQYKVLEEQKEKEIEYVLKEIDQLRKKVNDLKEKKEQLLMEVKTFHQYEIASQNLRKFQDIQKKLIEQNLDVHQCQRESHKCDQICQACPDKICDNKAGHDEKQDHLCMKQDHRCKNTCEIPQCSNTCMKSFNHNSEHNCLSDHPCVEKCQFCSQNCKKDRSQDHYTNHDCLDIYCTHNCKLCSRKCCQPHKHSIHKIEDHLCDNIHYCQELCQEEGICKIEYDIQQAIYKNEFAEFPYTKYVPKDSGKKKCQQLIPAKGTWHDGNHLCKDQTEKQFHYCNQICPECNTYCDLQYNHSGPHSSDRHRNKENQIFTTQEYNQANVQIKDSKDSTIKIYKLGGSSAPETCDQSCKRRGRAHFHLVKCEGLKKCLEKNNEYRAKHSYEKYVGFEHIKFDEVLCEEFWKLKNWVHPIYNELETIRGCNYYCPLCEYEKRPYSFCNQVAWHTQKDDINSHSFKCKENHLQNQIQGINVAFVIDSTGSMQRYIDMCKNTIKDIMKQAKAKKSINRDKFGIKFAAVSYKDHQSPYSQGQIIIQKENFTTEEIILQFLDKLQADGGDDAPEAVLDGLNAALGLKWDQNYERLLFLIADAPPHGKVYNNLDDNYPEGCPCGLKQDTILTALASMKVKLKIVKLNQLVDLMISEFKKDFNDLTIFFPDKKDEDNSFSMIVNDVCKCLTHTEITYQLEK